MRTRHANHQAALESFTPRSPVIVQFKSRYGHFLKGITNYAVDLTADFGLGDGPVVFKAVPGFNSAQMDFVQGLSGGSTQLETYITNRIEPDPVFNEDQVLAGMWRDAAVTVGIMHSRMTALTPIIMNRYKTGRMTLNGIHLEIELLPIGVAFDQSPLMVAQSSCGFVFGGSFPANRACLFNADPGPWVPSTVMTVRQPLDGSSGSKVRPVDGAALPIFNNRDYWCITGGTSHTSPPTFSTVIGATVTESGGVQWEVHRASTVFLTVDTVISRFSFTTTPVIDSPDDWFSKGGRCLFTTGQLPPAGPFTVATWTNATQRWDLEPDIALDRFNPKVGDEIKCTAICNKSNDPVTGHCATRWFNSVNHGGFTRAINLTDARETVKAE